MSERPVEKEAFIALGRSSSESLAVLRSMRLPAGAMVLKAPVACCLLLRGRWPEERI